MALAEREGDDMVKALIAGAAMNQLRALLTDQVMADDMHDCVRNTSCDGLT
jgi:hypothetical protein